jgi:ribosomal-protein-alanine N-acetyltransferase
MILTPHLRIISCDDTLYDAIRMGNNTLARVMGVNVPKKWTEFRDTFTPSYHRWKAHPPLRDWWVYLIIHVPDNMLIGSCGYKGEPDADGMVEIGYEVIPSYREKGLGTETAKGLLDHAFQASVRAQGDRTHAGRRKCLRAHSGKTGFRPNGGCQRFGRRTAVALGN